MLQVMVNALRVSCPEGFREMNESEKAGLHFAMEAPGICLTNPEKHMVVSIGWVKSGMASLLLSEKDAARKGEEKVSRLMKDLGYQLEEYPNRTLDEEKASGYRYHYTAQDIGMTGETLVAKHRKVFYYLNLYCRTELREESLKIWEEMLDAMRWKTE